jgi:hypothetical protein
MAVTIIATDGAANANSYCTLEEAEAYFETTLYTDGWDSASDEQKKIALIQGTRMFESNMWVWESYPTHGIQDGQALAWPRSGLLHTDLISNLPEAVVPAEMKVALCEMARSLLQSNRTADSDVETQGISSLSAGPISLSFTDSVRAKPVPDYVKALVPAHWGHYVGSGMTKPVRRG